MKHYLSYAGKNQSGVLEFETRSVSYLDTMSDRLTVYKKPLDETVPMVLCGKSTVFIVDKTHVEILKPLSPYRVGDFTFTLKSSDYALLPLYEKYKPKVLHFLNARKNRPMLLGSAMVGLMLLIVTQLDFDATSNSSGFDSNIHQMQPDLSGKDLITMRLKLANQAFEQKKYTLAIDLLDKVLATDPANPEAMQLKESALKKESSDKLVEQKTLKKDIHTKNLIDQALNLMTKKDYEGALFHLEQVLEETPNDTEAKDLYNSLQENMKKAQEEKQKETALQARSIDEAQRLWKQGERLLTEKNYSLAWGALLDATALLEENHLEPFFNTELKDSLAKAETELYNLTLPLAQQAKGLQNEGDRQSGIKKTVAYKNSLALYYEVKRKFSKFPLLDNEIAFVTKKLNESLKSMYTEAQVTHDLEGCCQARPLYIKIMEYAEFETVPYYAKAKEAVAQCSCR